MNFKLQRPDMLAQSQKNQKGWNVILEILLFVGLFIVSQIAISVVANIPIMGYMAASGLMQRIAAQTITMEEVMGLIMGPAMLCSLYAELAGIFLIIGLCRGIQKRKACTLGFKKRNWLKEYGIGMLAGLGMMTVAVLIGVVTGSLRLHINPDIKSGKQIFMLVLFFCGFLFQGMFEEVLCRGYFLISLARKKGNVWMGIIVSSLAFAALHLLNPGVSLLPIVNLTLFGIFAGIYFIKRSDLWGIGAIHSLWNFTQGNVFGVLVSGNDFGPSILSAEITESMSLMNGGTFGLEGGLIVTVVLIVCSLLALRLPQKDIAPAAEESVPCENADTSAAD